MVRFNVELTLLIFMLLFFLTALILLVMSIAIKIKIAVLKKRCNTKVTATITNVDTVQSKRFEHTWTLFYPVYEFKWKGETRTVKSEKGYNVLPEGRNIGDTLTLYFESGNPSCWCSDSLLAIQRTYSNLVLAVAIIMLMLSVVIFYNMLQRFDAAITQNWMRYY